MLQLTIQGLEMQQTTLAALQDMVQSATQAHGNPSAPNEAGQPKR
jgi:hypothetical protein